MSQHTEEKRRFLGLNSYPDDEFYQQLFYGRNTEINNITYSIHSGSSLLIYGQSGIGKSSLINCGLLPKLRKTGNFWPIKIEVKASKHYGSIVSQIKSVLNNDQDNTRITIKDENKKENTLLPEWINNIHIYCKGDKSKRLTPVLICDQFEDLYLSNNSGIDHKSTRRFKEDLETLNSLVDPYSIDKLYQKDFTYDNDIAPVLIISVVESYLGVLEPIMSVNESLRHNQHKIHGLMSDAASELLSNISNHNDPSFQSPPFTIPQTICDRIIEFSHSEIGGHLSPFFVQLYATWVEDKVIEGKEISDDEFPRKKFKNYLQNYYHEIITNIPKGLSQKKVAIICQEKLITKDGHIKYASYSSLNKKYKNEIKWLKKKRIIAEDTIGSQGEIVLKLVHSRLAEAIQKEANSEHAILTPIQNKINKYQFDKEKLLEKNKALKIINRITKLISIFLIGITSLIILFSYLQLSAFEKDKKAAIDDKNAAIDDKKTAITQKNEAVRGRNDALKQLKETNKEIDLVLKDNTKNLLDSGKSSITIADQYINKSNSHLVYNLLIKDPSIRTLKLKCQNPKIKNGHNCKKASGLIKSVSRKLFYTNNSFVIDTEKELSILSKTQNQLYTEGYSYTFSKLKKGFIFTDYRRRKGATLYEISQTGEYKNSQTLKSNQYPGYDGGSKANISFFHRKFCKTRNDNFLIKSSNEFKNQVKKLPKYLELVNLKKRSYNNKEFLIWSYSNNLCIYQYGQDFFRVASFPNKLSTILHLDIIDINKKSAKIVTSDISRNLNVIHFDEKDELNQPTINKSVELEVLPEALSGFSKNGIDWVMISFGKEIQLRPLPRLKTFITYRAPSQINATIVETTDNKNFLYGLSIGKRKIYQWDLTKNNLLPHLISIPKYQKKNSKKKYKRGWLVSAAISNSIDKVALAGKGNTLCSIDLETTDLDCKNIDKKIKIIQIERINFIDNKNISIVGRKGLDNNFESLLAKLKIDYKNISLHNFKENPKKLVNSIGNLATGEQIATTFKPSIIIGNDNDGITGYKGDSYVVAYQNDKSKKFLIAARNTYTNNNEVEKRSCVWYGKLSAINIRKSLCDEDEEGEILFKTPSQITWMASDISNSQFSVTDNDGTITWVTIPKGTKAKPISKNIQKNWKSIILEANGYEKIVITVDPFGRIRYFSPPGNSNKQFDLLAVQQIPILFSSREVVYDFDAKCNEKGNCTLVVPLGNKESQVYISKFKLLPSSYNEMD